MRLFTCLLMVSLIGVQSARAETLMVQAQRMYFVISQSFKARSVDALLEVYAPDFVQFGRKGDRMSRDAYLDSLKQTMSRMTKGTWKFKILDVRMDGADTMIVRVRSQVDMYLDVKGKERHFEGDEVDVDTWRITAKGMQLRRTEIVESHFSVDGKPSE